MLDRSTTTADLLDAHLTVQSIVWNAASMSGGVRWAHPVTGEPIAKPKFHYYLANPERDALVDGALCTCARCMNEENA